MKWEELLSIVGNEPVFHSSMLLAGERGSLAVRQQLSRWTAKGRLFQLRRGLYVLAPPWRKVEPHGFFLARAMFPGSYVSTLAALGYRGMVPEHVFVVTCVGAGRPGTVHTPLGSVNLRFLASKYRFGYEAIEVAPGQEAFVAFPEKALLDLVYLTDGADRAEYVRELRLQNLDEFSIERLENLAGDFKKPKMRRAAAIIAEAVAAEKGGWVEV